MFNLWQHTLLRKVFFFIWMLLRIWNVCRGVNIFAIGVNFEDPLIFLVEFHSLEIIYLFLHEKLRNFVFSFSSSFFFLTVASTKPKNNSKKCLPKSFCSQVFFFILGDFVYVFISENLVTW